MGDLRPSAEAAGGQGGSLKASKLDACGWKIESGPYSIQQMESTEQLTSPHSWCLRLATRSDIPLPYFRQFFVAKGA